MIRSGGTLTVAERIRAGGASLVLHGDAGLVVADRIDLSTLFATVCSVRGMIGATRRVPARV